MAKMYFWGNLRSDCPGASSRISELAPAGPCAARGRMPASARSSAPGGLCSLPVEAAGDSVTQHYSAFFAPEETSSALPNGAALRVHFYQQGGSYTTRATTQTFKQSVNIV